LLKSDNEEKSRSKTVSIFGSNRSYKLPLTTLMILQYFTAGRRSDSIFIITFWKTHNYRFIRIEGYIYKCRISLFLLFVRFLDTPIRVPEFRNLCGHKSKISST
jgi:hypothetical protein